ncbi:hypothetical protein [Streptomyces sp. NPDC004008]
MQSVDRSSREYVQALVDITVGTQPYNPTVDVVEFAFTAVNERPVTWYTGAWDGTSPLPGTTTYRAQILIGPGSPGPTLAPGKYQVWIRITDNPEQPVISFGWLSIT